MPSDLSNALDGLPAGAGFVAVVVVLMVVRWAVHRRQ